MPERRPFPPSPRRRALAHKAGLSAASPLLVGAAATGAAAAATVMLARAAATTLGGWIAAACAGNATLAPDGTVRATDAAHVLAPAGITHAVLELALPLLGVIAVIAIATHLAQTRAVWLPRRRIEGAPALPRRRGLLDIAGAAVIGLTAFAWLWLTAPRLARATSLSDAGAAIAAFVATLAIAWVALGALDALLRHAALGNALAMTAAEKRQDDRLAAADPRWRRRRAQLAREANRGTAGRASAALARATTAGAGSADAGSTDAGSVAATREAVASSTLLLLGDDVAVAIAWDPIHRPVPLRTATGRGPAATQLLGLARRHGIPVHRDATLAGLLAGDGPLPEAHPPLPEAHWPRIAEIVAAVRAVRWPS
jgi:flagellar biosynthesis protein FlhB